MKAHSTMSDAETLNILLVDDQPGKLLSYEVILKDLGENLIMAKMNSLVPYRAERRSAIPRWSRATATAVSSRCG